MIIWIIRVFVLAFMSSVSAMYTLENESYDSDIQKTNAICLHTTNKAYFIDANQDETIDALCERLVYRPAMERHHTALGMRSEKRDNDKGLIYITFSNPVQLSQIYQTYLCLPDVIGFEITQLTPVEVEQLQSETAFQVIKKMLSRCAVS